MKKLFDTQIKRRQFLAGANCSERVVTAKPRVVAADPLEARFDIPGREPPAFSATEGGYFRDRLIRLMGFDP